MISIEVYNDDLAGSAASNVLSAGIPPAEAPIPKIGSRTASAGSAVSGGVSATVYPLIAGAMSTTFS